MTQKWTFDAAVGFWRKHHNADLENVWDRFAAAEAYILDHAPRTTVEAEFVFDVLLEQGPDGRSDGRDREALQRLHAYVRGLHQTLTAAA